MTEVTRTFHIVNKHGFEAKMTELTRRFKVEFSVVWGTSYEESVEIARDEFINVWYHPCDVTFSFEEFKIDGYTYLGAIKDNDMIGLITIHGNELTEGLNLSDWVKSFDGIPCHACNRRHVRKIGHLFRQEASGDLQVFGSGCAKKYFGINFDRVLSFFETLQTRYDDWAEGEFRTYVAYRVDSNVAIKDAYYLISKYGYTSKSRAECESDSTAWAMTQFGDKERTKVAKEYDIITLKVDPSVIWETSYTKDPENKSDFEHNIEVMQEKLKFHLCGEKDFGMVAYMVWAEWFKPAPVEKAEYTLPEVEVGDKIKKVVVTFSNLTYFDGYYGRTYINELIDKTNNVRYKWFSSVSVSHKFEGIEFGTELFLKIGTVKKVEDDPKWGKSVILSRASLYEI